MQGRSLVPLLRGRDAGRLATSFYYHYYEADGPHAVAAHYGVATDRYKLIRYPATDEWELFDLETGPARNDSAGRRTPRTPGSGRNWRPSWSGCGRSWSVP